jgi:hypothetical protein
MKYIKVAYKTFFKSPVYWISVIALSIFRSLGYSEWWIPALITIGFGLLIPAILALIWGKKMFKLEEEA